ncbi:glycosyltransferase family protein [Yoonia algicola]|uniref:Glycosyltransferase n=1 Tax=Yoonia algicola TaxID=3137368 RepID=A0AAN0M8L6_9RHOB
MKLSSAKSISVDPAYRLSHEVMRNKPELYAYQETSDAFFKAGRLEQIGAQIDIAFLDGTHLFESLLRDFIATEKFCAKNGIVMLRGCLPWNEPMAMRDRGSAQTATWTGDVWKIVPVLKKYRPDLEIEILDAAPTGLVIVSNLDPHNTVLEDNYDEILRDFVSVSLQDYGVDRYFSALDIQSAADSKWLCAFPFELGKGWQSNPDISIKIAAPTRDKMTKWGDYHFARSLARAFCRLGHKATICPVEDWYADDRSGGIDLVLRGRANFRRQPGRLCLMWAISKNMRAVNYKNADHVFWASKKLFDAAENERGGGTSSLLPQAFDHHLMKLAQSRPRKGLAFVGRARAGFARSSVVHAAAANEALRIWGPGWKGSDYEQFVVADNVPNDDLPEIYQTAEIVLNDHTAIMKENGFLSNRVFDTLACGAIPLSEDVGWLPDDIADFVYVYHDQDSFEASLALARSEPLSKRRKRDGLAKKLATTHSFDARARQILAVAETIACEPAVP